MTDLPQDFQTERTANDVFWAMSCRVREGNVTGSIG